jgi:hypothetical protein
VSWRDIIKEDLTEKVIEVLLPMFENRKELFNSNIMGASHEENLETPYTKEDVKALIEDIQSAYSGKVLHRIFHLHHDDDKKVRQTLNKLRKLL